MKSRLLSLALLGSPASGCFLRPDKAASTPDERLFSEQLAMIGGPPRPSLEEKVGLLGGMELSPREVRVLGKQALKRACSHDAHFAECQQDRGSAKTLERCLERKAARGGVRLTKECRAGIDDWKKVLTETAPAANLARRQAEVAEDFIVPEATLVRKQLGAGPSKVKPAWHGRADHGDHPPPHHHGKGPHHAPPAGGGGHGKGPHHPGHFDQLGRASRLPEEERPTMFSVLADWIFGEETISEFSDVEEPWYRSPSKPVESLGPSWHLDDSSSSDDEGGEAAAVSHADIAVGDFFLYDDDYKAIMETREKPATLLLAGEEPPTPLHHKQLLHDEQPGSFRRKNLRGGEGPRPPCDKKPLRRPHPVEKADARPIDLPMKVRGVQITKRGGGGGGGSHFGGESSVSSARDREQGPPPRGGQQPEHHRRHGGDHIRFRNRLPEDFDFEKSDHHLRWFEDSFDPDGDGPDLVEGILALFFFVGAFTLLLLPFFLLGRALKRLVRSARGCGGGGDEDEDAPDGYLALPDDAASVPAVSAAHDHHDDDDDSIVVTGTPVNPPPSVHI